MKGRSSWAAGIGVGGVLAMVVAALIALERVPSGAAPPEVSQIGLLGAILLVYLGAGVWAGTRQSLEAEAALRIGSALGVLLGVLGATSLTLESLADLRPPFDAIVPASEMGAMVLLFGFAANRALALSRSWPLALLAAAWTAFTGTSVICAWGFLLQVAVLQARDPGSLQNTIDGAVEHLTVAPVLAVMAGAVAIAATLFQRSARPRTRIALALLDLLQGTVGIGLLVYAHSLVRSERPPFVTGGMLLTAAALAAAPAVLRIGEDPRSDRIRPALN